MNSDRFRIVGIFVVIFLILCGYFYFTQGRQNVQQAKLQKQQLQQLQPSPDNNNSEILPVIPTEKKPGLYYKVHVAGEVKNPGVYSLDSKDRVIDAIETAGGATENADLDRINLAEYIKDGEKVRIPNINERSTSNNLLGNYNFNSNKIEDIAPDSIKKNNYNLGSTSVEPTSTDLININTATVSELEQLPGIGSSIANNIVLYRQKNGNFDTIEDLKNVSRIGNKIFEKLKDLIIVN